MRARSVGNILGVLLGPGLVVSLLAALLLPGAAHAAGGASDWRVVPNPHTGSLLQVDGISTDDVWAVGYYYDFDAAAWSPLTEHWDGVRWTAIEPPRVGSSYNALQGVSGVARNDVWAVGYSSQKYYPNYPLPLVEHWNGSAWSVVKTPAVGIGELRSVKAIASDDVWAVGQKYSGGAIIEHWDGATWTVVPDDPGATAGILSGIDARSSTDVWAVGSYSDGTGGAAPLVEHWDGARWTIVPAPKDEEYSSLSSVALDGQGPVAWAVGSTNPGAQPMPLSERFDGGAWALVPTPYLGGGNNVLYDVAVTRSGTAWTVGYAFYGNNLALIMRWTGSKWRPVPDPAPSGSVLYSITSVGSELWAVGDNVILRATG